LTKVYKYKEIFDEVKEKYYNDIGSHDADHVDRVYKMCIHIGKIENADLEVLELAAILHDIARKEEKLSNGEICHALEGAKKAKVLMEKHDIADDVIGKVVSCIRTHRSRSENEFETLEAKILFDADKLDSIGAIGLARTFVFAGEIGSRVHNKDIDLENTYEYSKEDTAYREFLIKLSKIKDKMLTSEGKKIAEERHNYMVEFFKRINEEVDGLI